MNHRDQQPEHDVLDQAIDALRRAPMPDQPPELVASTVEALQSKGIAPELVRRQRRRRLMFRIAGLSGIAAAVTFIAIVIGSLLIVDQTESYAFGDVIDNIKKVKSVVFTNKQRIGDQPEFEFTWYVQGDRIRIEVPNVMVQVADIKKKKSIQLNLTKKTARHIKLGESALKAFANPLDQIRQVKPAAAKKIGREKLDNRDVDVYRIEKIDFLGLKGKGEMKLWVNPKTQLPVRIVIGVNTEKGAKATDRPFDTRFVLENFTWHASLDASLFRLEVPKGYTVVKE